MNFEELRAREFGRLDAGGHVYLDYTGAGLYAETQIRRHMSLLRRRVLGNPHSENPTSHLSTLHMQDARRRVLAFFRADPDEYTVVFTANASHALKLVGESYPFAAGSPFVLTADNHNSVGGIREFAQRRGAHVRYVPLDAELRAPAVPEWLAQVTSPALFAYPAQSNFTGVKHPLEWVALAQSRGYDVLLDAAAFVPTNPLDLSEVQPEYVTISFYKMFGYPTGVGALLVRRSALARLQRPWYAGGTVRFASAQNRLHLLKEGEEAFEDGTPSFLEVAAIPYGLDFLESVGMTAVRDHVQGLTALLLDSLRGLRHTNGEPVIRIYGPTTTVMRGGTVAFSVLDPAGAVVDSEVVQRACTRRNISLRSGCFCNPGAAEYAFGYDGRRAAECLGSIPPVEFTLEQFSDCMGGVPVGADRVSLGIASNAPDLGVLTSVLERFRDRPGRTVEEATAQCAV